MANRAPTLDDLNSLNLEIAALVEAGVPLELGLQGIASIKGSRLGLLANRISASLARGQTLSEAMTQEGQTISPVYAAVMKAGISSGKLPEALKSIATSGQIIQETRRNVMLAMIYPVICSVLAFVILAFFVEILAPKILMAVEFFPNSWPIRFLQWLHDNRNYLLILFPVVMIALFVLVRLIMSGATQGIWDFSTSLSGFIGQSLNWSQFTELLALQVEQGVPLHEAFVQAADATDNRRWQVQAREVAQKLKSGKSLSESLQSAFLLPPVVRWMMASGEKQGQLNKTLRQLTDLYRRQALRRAAIVKIWLPVTMTLVFTLGLGLTYSLAFFIPLRSFLFELMNE